MDRILFIIHTVLVKKIVLLIDFGHGGYSQRRSVLCARDIIVRKYVRGHRCTVCSLLRVKTLIIRWGVNPTRPERDQAQNQRLIIPPTSRLRAISEKFLLEKPNSAF